MPSWRWRAARTVLKICALALALGGIVLGTQHLLNWLNARPAYPPKRSLGFIADLQGPPWRPPSWAPPPRTGETKGYVGVHGDHAVVRLVERHWGGGCRSPLRRTTVTLWRRDQPPKTYETEDYRGALGATYCWAPSSGEPLPTVLVLFTPSGPVYRLDTVSGRWSVADE